MAIDTLKQKVDMLKEIGSTGLEYWGGNIYEEKLPKLSGSKAAKTYREMSDNDPVIGAIIHAIEMLIRQVEWRVEADSEDEVDEKNKEFLTSCMEDMSMTWSDTISEILSMLIFGWSYHEIVYKKRLGNSVNSKSRYNDGMIGWRKLPIRAQETLWEWVFGENGAVLGLEQQAPPNYKLVTIPIEKALLFRTKSTKGNPEGRSILRNAYRPWYFKKHIETIEGIGIERDLAGLPIAWVPPEIMDSSADAEAQAVYSEVKKIVRNIRRDEQEGIVFPLAYDENGNKMYDLNLLTSGGRRQFDTDKIVQRYDQRIAMTVLADFILLGHEKVGSFALSSSKTDLFAVSLGTWLQSIADVFNREAIPRLFAMNGISTENLPILVPGDIENTPLDELGTYIKTLADAGMPLFPNEELEEYLMRIASLPKPMEKPPGAPGAETELPEEDMPTPGAVPEPEPPEPEEEQEELLNAN